MLTNIPEIELPSDDVRLWRYMDVGRFLALLRTSELYFARRCELDDKWEGCLPAALASQFSGSDLPGAREMRAAMLARFDKDIDRWVVSCWHENDQESVAMWSLYTTGQEGVAIQTTAGLLKAHMMSAALPVIRIGRVQYIDHDCDSTPFNFPGNGVQLLCKRRSYSHEREVRALFYDQSQDPTTGRGVGVPVVLPRLIEKIVVSPEYPRWAVPALQDAVNRAGVMLKIEPSDLLRRPDLDAHTARG